MTLTTNGPPDEVMAVAASFDDTLRYGAQTPFSDQLSFQWEGGMWEYDAYHSSIITAGNGGTKPARAAFTLFYNQGAEKYELEQTLQPDEQLWIDVGKLIREHVPDKNGKTLPAGLSSGSFEVRDLTDVGVGSLFEGKLIYDKTYGHVTYGCSLCCVYDPPILNLDPIDIPFLDNTQNGVAAYNSCSGIYSDVSNAFYYNWSTLNTAIATVNATALHHGAGVGSTTSNTHGWLTHTYARNCPAAQYFPSCAANVVVVPKIMFGGKDITGTTQSVVVGQQIALTASYPAGVTVNSQSWSVPGTIVGGFVHNNTNGGTSPVNLKGASTTFYWVASGTSTITFTLNYGNSQTATAQATFNIAGVASPLVSTPLGQIQISSGPILEFGDPSTTPGIMFTKSATPPLGYPGSFEWVQVITKSNVACISSSGTKNTLETPGLDNGYPYSTSASTSDSPAQPLPSVDTQVTWDFAAQMYLMWRPGLTNDIFVPLGYVAWQFFGDGVQNTTTHTWSVQTDSKQSANPFVQSSSYPTWTSTLTNTLTPCP